MRRTLLFGIPFVLACVSGGCTTGSEDDHQGSASSGESSGGSPNTSSNGGAPSNGGAGGSGTTDTTSSSETSASGGAGGSTSSTGEGGSGGYIGMACSVNGNPGVCREVSDCEAMDDYTPTPGYCPGPSDVQCCAKTPNVADNPPIPNGYKPMTQSQVTPEMTDWAVMILHDPDDYPMFSTATKAFGSLTVLARVEWHPPDFQNNVVHRGVTLYQPG